MYKYKTMIDLSKKKVEMELSENKKKTSDLPLNWFTKN